MNVKRVMYWTALLTAAGASLGLHLWALWLGPGLDLDRHGFGHGSRGWVLGGFWLLVLVGLGVFLWYRQKQNAPIDPLGDLASEYVEGRLTREEFLARKAVLEEER